ncbi:MAG: hypothetical protein NTW62_00760 [Candidatus Nomurabacteria bacterium]|nr:hypothetical protein [Candidatus Nomurabacteria bacterium]
MENFNPNNINEEVKQNIEKKVFKAVLVDTTDVMKSAARDAADEKMTLEPPENPEDLKGMKKFFKSEFWKRTGTRIWKHGILREYTRNKEIYKAREKILNSGNIGAGEDKDQAYHDKFVNDLVNQFSSEYETAIHTDAGEMKKVYDGKKEDSEVNRKEESVKNFVKEKIKEYATGKISEAGFLEFEKHLFGELKGDIEGKQVRTDVMHASNMLEIAKQVKKAMENGQILADEDFEIDLIYGKSKGDVRTESKFTHSEKWAEKISETKIGQFVNETTVATAIALATSLSRSLSSKLASNKAAQFMTFGGSALISGIIAKSRKQREMIQNRTHHNRDMAKGLDYGEKDLNRKEMENFRVDTIGATAVIEEFQRVQEMIASGDKSITPEILQSILVNFSQIEARVRLSDKEHIDMIHYSDPSKVVEERWKVDIERSKLKAELIKMSKSGKLEIPEGYNFDTYISAMTDTQVNALVTDKEHGIDVKDRAFNKMKRSKGNKAALTGFITGLTIGTLAQEAAVHFTHRTGIIEDVYHDIKGDHVTGALGGVEKMTGLAYLKHYVSSDMSSHFSGNNVHEFVMGSNTMKLPEGMNLVHNPDGSFNLLNGKDVIGNHLTMNGDGTFSKEAIDVLHKNGIDIKVDTNYASHLEKHTYSDPADYIKDHPKGFHNIERKMWYDNDTKEFDQNELRTYWSGENGTGINGNGDYVLDVGHMTPDGSFHGDLSANARELLAAGKLKMLFTMSEGTQNHAMWVDVDANGKINVEHNSELGKLFFSKVNGHAQFNGRFGEVAEDLGDGKFKILGTMEGKGLSDISTYTGAVDEIHKTNFIIPGKYDYRVPPFIPVVPGDPLEPARKKAKEDKNKKEQIKDKKSPDGQVILTDGFYGEEDKNTLKENKEFSKEVTEAEYGGLKDDLKMLNKEIQSHHGIIMLEESSFKSEYGKKRYNELAFIKDEKPTRFNKEELQIIGNEMETYLSGVKISSGEKVETKEDKKLSKQEERAQFLKTLEDYLPNATNTKVQAAINSKIFELKKEIEDEEKIENPKQEIKKVVVQKEVKKQEIKKEDKKAEKKAKEEKEKKSIKKKINEALDKVENTMGKGLDALDNGLDSINSVFEKKNKKKNQKQEEIKEVPFDKNINNIFSIMTDTPKTLEREIDSKIEQAKDLPRRNKQAFMIFESDPAKVAGLKKKIEELKLKYPTAHFEFITPSKKDKETIKDNDTAEEYMKKVVKEKMSKVGLNEDDVMNFATRYK